MAKFIKSIFNPSERRKSRYEEGEERSDVSPPLDGRRKLSISRSGRMKANKKRLSFSMDVYGQELHNGDNVKTECNAKRNNEKGAAPQRRLSKEVTPEEEIDNAFVEIINKS